MISGLGLDTEYCDVFSSEGEIRNPVELPDSAEVRHPGVRKQKADHLLLNLPLILL